MSATTPIPSFTTLTREERREILRHLVQKNIDRHISPAGQPIEREVMNELTRMITSGELEKETQR